MNTSAFHIFCKHHVSSSLYNTQLVYDRCHFYQLKWSIAIYILGKQIYEIRQNPHVRLHFNTRWLLKGGHKWCKQVHTNREVLSAQTSALGDVYHCMRSKEVRGQNIVYLCMYNSFYIRVWTCCGLYATNQPTWFY